MGKYNFLDTLSSLGLITASVFTILASRQFNNNHFLYYYSGFIFPLLLAYFINFSTTYDTSALDEDDSKTPFVIGLVFTLLCFAISLMFIFNKYLSIAKVMFIVLAALTLILEIFSIVYSFKKPSFNNITSVLFDLPALILALFLHGISTPIVSSYPENTIISVNLFGRHIGGNYLLYIAIVYVLSLIVLSIRYYSFSIPDSNRSTKTKSTSTKKVKAQSQDNGSYEIKKIAPRTRKSILKNKELSYTLLIEELIKALTRLKDIDVELIKGKLAVIKETLDSQLLVTVLGEFSSGKSTFINALLGEKLLAMKIKPTTATITKIEYGKNRQLIVHFLNGKTEAHPLDKIDTFTVERFVSEDRILDDIHYVQVTIDNDLLAKIDIADTPGFNSHLEKHTDITANFISYSETIIWLFDANQTEKQTTFDLIEKHCKYNKPIGIINKIDNLNIDSEDTDNSKEYVIESLKRAIEPYTEVVFPVSSKLALNKDVNSYKESGLQAVVQYFRDQVIPKAEATKKKITFFKLTQVATDIAGIRQGVQDKISVFESRINSYNHDVNSWLEASVKYEEAIEKWNYSMENPTYGLENVLDNVNCLFFWGSVPEDIERERKSFRAEMSSLIKADSKFNEMLTIINNNTSVLNNRYASLMNRWNEYNDNWFGIKRWFDDNLDAGSNERARLNNDSAVWDNDNRINNEQVDAYNNGLAVHQGKWDLYVNKLSIYIDDKVLPSFNKKAAEHDNEQHRLQKQFEDLNTDWTKYQQSVNNYSVLEHDILEIVKALKEYAFKESIIDADEAVKDFNQIIESFVVFQVKEIGISSRELYSRGQISKVLTTHKQKYESAYSESVDRDDRKAPRIK
ncbi:MAG: dynamin family protein [Candidatus Cloacimonadaceae bacterium]|nr:dynamin family protein [Candidatus Cloacimonadaceae bacterium]